MKQDYNGVRTAQDLERKYDFTNLEKVNEINNNIIQANKTMLTSNMNTELKLFVEAVTKYMQDYSVDGNITTYYYSGIPSLNNNPAVEWDTDEEKNNHIWDLYYNKETGYVYMFTLEDETYSWQRLEDYDVEKALALANAARDTKDNQRRLFLQQPVPPYESGDMWKNGDEILICQIGKPGGETYAERDFIIDSKYVDNTVATEVNNKLTVLSGSVLEIENGVDRYSRTLNQTIKVVDEHGNYIGDRSTKTTSITQDLDGFNLQIGQVDMSKGSLSQQTAQLRADINEIRGEIGDITDVTITKDGIGVVYFNEDDESINESQPLNMSIYPTSEDLSRLYPSTNLFPSTTMYPIELSIDFYNQTEDEHIYYPFPKNLRKLGTTYDEFVYDYENEECKVIRRIGLDASGNKYILQNPEEEEIEFPEIHLTTGKYVVTFIPFNTAYMKIRLMSQNMYTSQFATKVEMKGEFSLTKSEFNTKLSKKVGNDEVISRINQTAEQITIAANKVNISGVITAINGETSTTIDGSKITTGTLNASKISGGTIDGENVTITNLHADNIIYGTLRPAVIAPLSIDASKMAANTITGDKISANTIDGANIKAATIDGTNIKANTIDAGNIKANAITSDKISVINLSSINSDLGSVNAGNVSFGNGKLKLTNAGSLQYYNTPGFIYCGGNTSNHPYVSALNVATQGGTGGGISFRNSQDRTNAGTAKAGIAYGGDNDEFLIETATARMDIKPGGAFQIQSKNDDNITLRSGANIGLSPKSTSYYVRVDNKYFKNDDIIFNSSTRTNARITSGGTSIYLVPKSGGKLYYGELADGNEVMKKSSYSSKNVKTNITKIEDYDSLYNDLKKINMYDYDFKYDNLDEANYGFIIDEIEKAKHLSKYFKGYKETKYIKDNKLYDTKVKGYDKKIKVKEWDTKGYIKGLFILIKTLQEKTEELQKKNEDLEKRVEMLEKGDDK